MTDKVDTALREWAARHAPDGARRRALEDRILQAHREGRTPAPIRPYRGWNHAILGVAAGIAATLVAVFLLPRTPGPHDAWKALLIEESGLFADRRPAVTRVFGETERLFGPSLQWVSESGREVELGVSDVSAPGEPLIVRVTVVARRNGSDQWRRLWRTEVAARPDEMVEVGSVGEGASHVAIWMHRLEGGAALVESRLTLQAPLRLESESSEVLRFGATRSVTQFRHGGTEYRILQTVAPMGGGACSS